MERVDPWTISSIRELDTSVSIILTISIKLMKTIVDRPSISVTWKYARPRLRQRLYSGVGPSRRMKSQQLNSVHRPEAGELGIWVPIVFMRHVTGVKAAVKHGRQMKAVRGER